MKKLLYIGHAYHNKTQSSAFFKEMLNDDFDVEFLNFDPYTDNMETHFLSLSKKHFDIVVFWQIMPELDKLKKYFSFEHCAFFPMYDGVPSRDNPIWYQYRNTNIICFSKTLHDELKTLGFSSYYFQFFPKPIKINNWGNEKSIFFWQRINYITIDTVDKLIDFSKIKHIHMHRAIDPEHTFVEPPAYLKQKVTQSTWFDTREEMQEKMQESAIYIAPRIYEGIGMSFLEAMAMGRCVIAPNNPTMNEYIVNGENGILYDFNNPQPVDLADVRAIQKRTEKYIQNGYKQWTAEKSKIVDVLTVAPVINPDALKKKYHDNRYRLFDIIPSLHVYGTQTYKTYKLFDILPFVLIKGDKHRKRIYVFGIPVLKIKG